MLWTRFENFLNIWLSDKYFGSQTVVHLYFVVLCCDSRLSSVHSINFFLLECLFEKHTGWTLDDGKN
jgi:hypothetical protein